MERSWIWSKLGWDSVQDDYVSLGPQQHNCHSAELNKCMLNEWRREGKKEVGEGAKLDFLLNSCKIWIIIFTTGFVMRIQGNTCVFICKVLPIYEGYHYHIITVSFVLELIWEIRESEHGD